MKTISRICRALLLSFTFTLFQFSMFGQQLICPEYSGTGTVAPPGSTPFSTSWKNELPIGQKTIPVVVHL